MFSEACLCYWYQILNQLTETAKIIWWIKNSPFWLVVVLWWRTDTFASCNLNLNCGLCTFVCTCCFNVSHEFCPLIHFNDSTRSKIITCAIYWLHAETKTFVHFKVWEKRAVLFPSSAPFLSFRLLLNVNNEQKSGMQERYSHYYGNQGKASLDKASWRKLYSTFNCWINSLHSVQITGNNFYIRFT